MSELKTRGRPKGVKNGVQYLTVKEIIDNVRNLLGALFAQPRQPLRQGGETGHIRQHHSPLTEAATAIARDGIGCELLY